MIRFSASHLLAKADTRPTPECCLRALRKESWILGEARLCYEGFQPEDPAKQGKEHQRDDGMLELSVNWEDDANAVSFTFSLGLAGYGIARLRKEKVEIQLAAYRELVKYERKRDPKNPKNHYHGNVIMPNPGRAPIVRMVAAALALSVAADDIIRR